MEWFTAVVELIKVLVWPALVLTFLLLFRRPLRELLAALKDKIVSSESLEGSLNVGQAELKLKLTQAKAATELLELLPATVEQKPPLEIERGTAPTIVFDRSERLADSLISFAEGRGLHYQPGSNPVETSRHVARELLMKGAIRGEIYNAVDILCDLLEKSAQTPLDERDDATVDRLLSAILDALK